MSALREKPDAIVDACRTLGLNHLYMPAVPPEERDMAADGWRALGRELGQIAERFQGQGIRLGYHNHHWELKPKDGQKTALELIFEAAGQAPSPGRSTWPGSCAAMPIPRTGSIATAAGSPQPT